MYSKYIKVNQLINKYNNNLFFIESNFQRLKKQTSNISNETSA